MTITLKFLLKSNKIAITNYINFCNSPYYSSLVLKYNNITYYYYVKGGGCEIYYNKGFIYNKDFFYLTNYSNFKLFKNYFYKCRMVRIKSIKYNIIYLFFIYNKYYTYGKVKTYDTMRSISSKKIYNCRDFYKIYSYI